jgi:hypothetical protein
MTEAEEERDDPLLGRMLATKTKPLKPTGLTPAKNKKPKSKK